MFKWEFDIAAVEFIETDNNGDYNIHLYSRNEPIVVRGSCTIMFSNGKILIQWKLVDDEQAETNALVYAEAVVENGMYGEWDWETDRIETERL